MKQLSKIWLFIVPFLTFFLLFLYDFYKGFINRPGLGPNFLTSLIYSIIISVVFSTILFMVVLLFIWALSKIKSAGDKDLIDGLIGGGISFLIALFIFYIGPELSMLYLIFGVWTARTYPILGSLLASFFSLPTVLVATTLTKNKWKGVIIGCLVYLLMSLSYLGIRFLQHGP